MIFAKLSNNFMISPSFLTDLSDWLLSSGLKIVFIILLALLFNYILKSLVNQVIKRYLENKVNGRQKQKADTLIGVTGGVLSFIVWALAILAILSEGGLDIGPILAGLGLAGLAVGMAAKDILADFISGLFIILEGQYFVGDQVTISGVAGEVKEITLRRTILKDKDGVLHSFPNSQIKVVSRLEK